MVSLAQARAAAFENRKLARAGGDPLAVRRHGKVPTFREAAERVIDQRAASFKNGSRQAAIWQSSLKRYVFPSMGRIPVDKITIAHCTRVLSPIWHTKHDTAKKVKDRLSLTMKWAIGNGFREDNPALMAAEALGKVEVIRKHMTALPWPAVGATIRKVWATRASDSTKRAIEFLTLTAARSGEVRLAMWDEMDLDGAVWTIPAERMKAKRAHRVPLSDRAVAILRDAEAATGGVGLVFPSPRGKALSDNSLSKLFRDNNLGCVPHGFRSSFRDWCGETGVPREVAEMALAHVVGGVEGAYARSDLLERRRELMESWAQCLSADSGKVLSLVSNR